MTNVPPPPTPNAQKKGLSTGAKVAIGCGIVALIAAIVVGGALIFGAFKAKQYVEGFEKSPVATTGRTYAALHPDIEFVEADEDEKRVTFRNKKTGETVTLDVADLEQGKITWESSEKGTTTIETGGEDGEGSLQVTGPDGSATFRSGKASADDLPAWVVRYPDAEVSGAFSASSKGKRSGTYTIKTGDDLESVVQHFKDELESNGYAIETSSISGGGQELRMLKGENAEESREISVTVSLLDGKTQAAVTYEGPEE